MTSGADEIITLRGRAWHDHIALGLHTKQGATADCPICITRGYAMALDNEIKWLGEIDMLINVKNRMRYLLDEKSKLKEWGLIK